jgi:2-phosphosulfolactate phosphatase
MEVEVILHPAEIALLPQAREDLRGAACVVFDVLRATTSIVTAFAEGGARAVYPAATLDEARALKATAGPLSEALLGGERGGLALPGFDLGNSPREYAHPERLKGRDIVATTTNGTVALRACVLAGASVVHVAALRNLAALAAHLRDTAPARLCIVCAGTVTAFSLEDGFGAGALLARLGKLGAPLVPVSDAVTAVISIYERYRGDAILAFREAANGRRLIEIGLGDDLPWCAQTSVCSVLPALSGVGLTEGAIRLL